MIQKNGWKLITGTLLMAVVMAITGKPMKHPATSMGIVHLELAAKATDVQNILNAWDNDISQQKSVIVAARLNTWLDFIFLAFYTSLFYFWCKKRGASFNAGSFWGRAAAALSIAAVIAGLLDVGENIGMLLSLYGHVNDRIALFTAICSGIKWALIAIVLLFLLTCFWRRVFYLKNSNPPDRL